MMEKLFAIGVCVCLGLTACSPQNDTQPKGSLIYECTSWKFPDSRFQLVYPSETTEFSGNGFLGIGYYTTMTFDDLLSGKRVTVHENDSFACSELGTKGPNQ